MTSRQWMLLILCAVIGYGSLAWLFPRYDPSSQWQVQLDRAQVLAQSQTFAAQQGVDVTHWSSSVQTTRDQNHERYLRDNAVEAFLPGLPDHSHAPSRDLLQQFVVAKVVDAD